ncbi:hypothetical protein HAX54_039309 [Datura stramonium]|uniref:Uncharacterized protein n=1 Tax=Datura stramonium TaxID=4076 RepID=A0ABS8VPK9_DATST|nr:hypothetical protein [Datura stramonium]
MPKVRSRQVDEVPLPWSSKCPIMSHLLLKCTERLTSRQVVDDPSPWSSKAKIFKPLYLRVTKETTDRWVVTARRQPSEEQRDQIADFKDGILRDGFDA